MSKLVEIACDIKHVTNRGGVLISDGTKEVWIPLTAIQDSTDDIKDSVSTTIFITEWLAEEKGLI